ncbi:MAG: YIP1 family protein [Bacteroidetes bacterium]|jgi:hypothetical protein|nr:YIP1 family protein [Bacteroidota bacterium]
MTCTVCGAENPSTATVCHTCKAFLQNRVPTLDLFSTAWRTMTVPSQAFHEIAIAEHKNYAVSLFAAAGIPVVGLTVAWVQAGDVVGGLFETTGAVFGAGLVVGALLGLLTALVHTLSSVIVRGDVSYRRSLGVTAYALVPSVAVGLVLIPIALLTFGEHWYVGNPPPSTINAASFWTIVVLHALAALWSFGLLVIGGRVALRIVPWRALIVASASVGIVAAGWMWLARFGLRLLMESPISSIPGT